MRSRRSLFIGSGLAVFGLFVSARPAAADDYVYPLKLSSQGAYLADQNEQPFLVQGDAPWSLIVQLTLAEAEQYLDNRRQKGFNLLMVNLIEHLFADNPPFNRNGDPPFTTPGDFSTPNEPYFAHADQVINLAAAKGIVILLAPAYLGYQGGDQGWYQEMQAAGTTVLRDYGRYVGERYRLFNNIIWLHGGDYDPPDPQLVHAVAAGVREVDERHLHTAHCAPETSPLDIYGGAAWLDFNNTYSYAAALYAETLDDLNRPDFLPFIMIESRYENEGDATPQRIRRQAYWSNLTGTSGQLFGNRPIWLFDPGWQAAMDGQGSMDMQRVGLFFSPLRWWDLVPDQTNSLVTNGYGTFGQADYVTAAGTADGTLAVAYLPSTGVAARTITIDGAQLSGPTTARWYNPTNGTYVPAAESPLIGAGPHVLTSPGDNGTGTNDWVLMLEAESSAVPTTSSAAFIVMVMTLIVAGAAILRRRTGPRLGR